MVIDTGIFIECLRTKDKTKTTLFSLPDETEIIVSVVTVFELYCGATSSKKWNDVEKLMTGIEVIPLSQEISIEAALIFAELKNVNKIIEFRDIFIAATARALQVPIRTFNKNHFSRIKNIIVI